ncbi:MAG: TerB N-terminal domain-containing protein [Pseudomonadota bacterium]|nr:TerB N-terminal domain-containing protein [Pseudomonadota bacterium]
MARKSSGLPIVAVGVLIALAAAVEAIKNYWPALLVVGGAGLAFWLFKKPAAQPSTTPQDSPDSVRVSVRPNHVMVDTPSRSAPTTTAQDGDKLWLPEGKSTSVAGYFLEGGLIYVGKGLVGGNGWQQDAALIDPSLPVSKQIDDYSVRNLNYWPSYAEATPEARAAYLKWLAKGRSDPHVDMGYVFLYFYGLERRALVDVLRSDAAKEEIPTLIREVERLLTIYSDNGSFRHYANSLVDFLKADRVQASCWESPPSLSRQGELTFSHRYCLGQISNSRKVLSGEWAYVWLLGDPTTRLKTAAQRCPDEFKRAFIGQYTREFKASHYTQLQHPCVTC